MSPDEEREKFSGDERSMQAKRHLQTSEPAPRGCKSCPWIFGMQDEYDCAYPGCSPDAPLDNSPSGNIASPSA